MFALTESQWAELEANPLVTISSTGSWMNTEAPRVEE